jgi:hypothetical protein
MPARFFLIGIGLLTVVARGPVVAGGSDAVWRRWAVVCSQDVRSSGLGDVVTVELGKIKDLQLVERDELVKIEGELELGQLLGSPNAGRLELGRRLKADGLVLLARSGAQPKAPLRLVIADCLQGARLYQQELAQAVPLQMAQQVKEAILATRRRFPQGVTRILGVSDFLDRNLTHDFSALQSRYAGLLGSSLSLAEGVALLEIDEARSIPESWRARTSVRAECRCWWRASSAWMVLRAMHRRR